MADNIYYGYSANGLYQIYLYRGFGGIEKLGFTDPQIIEVLGRYCIGREFIIPELKKAGWSLERLLKAETEFGIDPESMELITADFNALDRIDYSRMTLMEMRQYLDQLSPKRHA